jgi:hypothetical protein
MKSGRSQQACGHSIIRIQFFKGSHVVDEHHTQKLKLPQHLRDFLALPKACVTVLLGIFDRLPGHDLAAVTAESVDQIIDYLRQVILQGDGVQVLRRINRRIAAHLLQPLIEDRLFLRGEVIGEATVTLSG